MSASTWGNPNATKHVFLIHGLTGSSHTWHRLASEFASRGYFVTAPDLLGHGSAAPGSDYTVAALAHELQPYFTPTKGSHPYHIVIGHSLGAIVALAMFPLLKATRSVRVVLVDPPFELTPELIATYKAHFHDRITNPKAPDTNQDEWTKEVAIFSWLSARLCDVSTMEAVFDQNVPWSFSHQLLTAPDNVKVTVLAADPSKFPCVREEDLRAYPDVTAKTVWGASHLIPFEVPQVVIETALQGTESVN